MDKALSTILLVIAGLVSALLAINAIYPATTQTSGAISSVSTRMGDLMKSQIEIIHAVGELDGDGVWQDTNSDGEFDVFVWVKNVGSTTIVDVESSDLFLGTETNWSRITHYDLSGSVLPSWDYQIEGGGDWGQADTMMIEVSYENPLSTGDYSIKLIIPNGVSDEYDFSM